MKKEPKRSFGDKDKEPIIERVFALVERYPSRNEAAKAWGININTLQNYYKRRDITPTPRKQLLEVIAHHEGVSLEWLMDGIGEPPKNTKKERNAERDGSSVNCYDIQLASIFSILTEEEKQSLFEILVRKGVDTVLRLKDDRNIQLIQCNESEKSRLLMMLESGVKKETSSACEDVVGSSPSDNKMKAG